jgi:hypothetical protein
MSEKAFLIFPSTVAATPDDPESGAGRLAQIADGNSAIDRQLRARLEGFEVYYMAGVGGWTVRTSGSPTVDELRARLAGLQVKVADESQFSTL